MVTRWAITTTASAAEPWAFTQRATWFRLLPMRATCRVRSRSTAPRFPGMAKMGLVGLETVDWFNGGLFDYDTPLPSRTPTRHRMIRMRGLRG